MATFENIKQYNQLINSLRISCGIVYATSTSTINKMKVFALTLCLAAIAQARVTYRLQCSREEQGIRYPSYFSNSEYYVCPGINAKQVTAQCNPGQVFTFVLQQCTAPSSFVPPPPIDMLPIGAPIQDIIDHDLQLPKPVHNADIHPPIFNGNSNIQLPQFVPPVHAVQVEEPVNAPVHIYEPEVHEPAVHEPAVHEPEVHEPAVVVEPMTPMMPPTPAPTPPNVVKPAPGGKKPSPSKNSGNATPAKPAGKKPLGTPAKPGAKTPAGTPAKPGAKKPAGTPAKPAAKKPAGTPAKPAAKKPTAPKPAAKKPTHPKQE